MLSPLTPLWFKAGEDAKSLVCSLGAGFWFPFSRSHCLSLTAASHAGSQAGAGTVISGSGFAEFGSEEVAVPGCRLWGTSRFSVP